MMALSKEPSVSLREAVEALLAPELTGPLDELADVLMTAAGAVGRLRRVLEPEGAHVAELATLDLKFTRSIILTRQLRERAHARRPRGEYTSLSQVAREVVGTLQEAAPEGVSLSLRCPPGPAIVAADREDLRRMVVGLIETGLELGATRGTVDLQIAEAPGPPGDRQRRVVQIEVSASEAIDEADIRIATAVRPLVRALGGTVLFRAPLRGGTAVSIRLPCAC